MPIRKRVRRGQETLRNAERLLKSPDDIEIYHVKKLSNVGSGEISQNLGLPLSRSEQYTLYKYGTFMNYHGFRTRCYSLTDIRRLLGVSEQTTYNLLERGVLDQPMVFVRGERLDRKIWFYHQVQPLYSWYLHLRNKTTDRVVRRYSPKDIGILNRMKAKAITEFHKRSGIPRVDPYREVAGPFGVIWTTTENVRPF